MKTDDFDYYLPEELIAQVPLEHREESRLLVLDKNNGKKDNKKYDAIVKIKGKNGKMERWGLKDGSLVLIE